MKLHSVVVIYINMEILFLPVEGAMMTGASVGVPTTENYIFPISQLVLYSNHRD